MESKVTNMHNNLPLETVHLSKILSFILPSDLWQLEQLSWYSIWAMAWINEEYRLDSQQVWGNFLFSTVSRMALGLTQSPIQLHTGRSFPWGAAGAYSYMHANIENLCTCTQFHYMPSWYGDYLSKIQLSLYFYSFVGVQTHQSNYITKWRTDNLFHHNVSFNYSDR